MLVIGLVVSGGIGAWIWWEERPLAEVESLLEAGQPLQALEAVDRYLHEHPRHESALSLKARILVAHGEPAMAIDLFERVGAANPEELHAWAQALLLLERWSAARPILEFLLETEVDRANVLHELAACRLKLGDFEGALAAATDFSREHGMGARGMLLIGTVHRERGNFRRAAEAWEELLKQNPDADGLQISAGEFFLEYGRVLMTLGEPERAAEMIQRSLSQSEHPDALVALGDAEAQLSRRESAEAAYRRALELDFGNRDARIGLAQLKLTDNDAAAAQEWLAPLEYIEPSTVELAYLFQRTSVQLGDEPAVDRWRRKADELREQERIHNTVDQLLRNNPDSIWAHVVRAWQFAESGNWIEAEVCLARVDSVADEVPFIADLSEAVKTRGRLPPLEELPVPQH